MYLQQMINHIQSYTSNISPNDSPHSHQQKMNTRFPANIWIEYPGYKTQGNICDFRVMFSSSVISYRAISHNEIINELYTSVKLNPNYFSDYYNFIIDIANNWEHINLANHSNISFINFTKEEIIEIICYISCQEEINYPSGNGFDGYRRPFYSYLEGINAASPNPSISINQTISRCNAKRRFLPFVSNAIIPYSQI
ncbi:MAG TPA: hypothetical protein DCR62_02810 [Acholeplasmatales bacterium]|nr:hypothetical protein [Bacilli bacterium]HAR57653.1 hypothetical protein [Acholeplasmatales bacterium]